MNSNPARQLFPIALAHFTVELCNNFLPILYPLFIVTMGLNYSQVGLAASLPVRAPACRSRCSVISATAGGHAGSLRWQWSGPGC
mgnify:CR=1 FL=1